MPTVSSGTLTWTGLHGFEPTNRAGHSLTVLPREHGNAILMFGGRELNGGQTNDLYRFDVGECRSPRRGTWMWSMQPTAPSRDPPPPPREGHSATIFRNYFVIFGGLGLDGLLNDIYHFDLDTLVWSRPETSGVLPIRRHQHSSCTFSRNLVIFGGYSEYGDSENDVAGNRRPSAAPSPASNPSRSTCPSCQTLYREPYPDAPKIIPHLPDPAPLQPISQALL
ncbi:hypothetical protein T484DRAFT_1771645 [Baffinella frigidus]|nr:hypothetical protein T484DRAFT_1771645 [Cryptophyta sp. CCMP2293]